MQIFNYSRNDFKKLGTSTFSHTVLIQIASTENQFEAFDYPIDATFRIVLPDLEFDEPDVKAILKIKKAVLYAINNDFDILCQCDAGLSRSGAVVQYAVDKYNFKDPKIERQPNKLIYKALMGLL